MEYEVFVHKKARDYYRRLSPEIQKRIIKALRKLNRDPYFSRPKADIKKLKGTKGRKPAYRVRVGDYRIVYDVCKKKIYVTIIFKRGKGYREL